MKSLARSRSRHRGYHRLRLDIDWIDPEDAPGVGTPVRGGAPIGEAHLAMEILADHGDC